jgi:hypothetical protein
MVQVQGPEIYHMVRSLESRSDYVSFYAFMRKSSNCTGIDIGGVPWKSMPTMPTMMPPGFSETITLLAWRFRAILLLFPAL